MQAKITEIFKSIQGEGLYQGAVQVFVRFFGCHLKCAFCDTKPENYQEMTVEQVVEEVLNLGEIHSVSLTGGEPLEQIDFVIELVKALKAKGLRIYLETNGVLFLELRKVMEYIDIIAMDFKLPSSAFLKTFWKEHREFLAVASKKEVFVKAVIGKDTQLCDILTAIAIIKEINSHIFFILQSQYGYEAALKDKLESYQRTCFKHNICSRIVNQAHKELGIR